ncbi:hypothetical protein ACHAXA_002357 [Cyclostephanos tholiformis]|uniref:Uncharacterized protein n=1 Tax=Cyclostephanos tholiformis TaxID=382380 RepID=A0ABD3SSB8_9STRA
MTAAADVVPTTEDILEAVDCVQENTIEGGGVVASSSGARNPKRKSSNSRFEVTRHPVRLDDIRDRRERQSEVQRSRAPIPPPSGSTIPSTSISRGYWGGDWASSVPSRCEFEVRVDFLPCVNIDDVKRDVETTMRGRAGELGLGLDIACEGFHADGAVDDENVNGGSRSLQRDFVETIQRCNHLVLSSSSPHDVGGFAIPIKESSREL